MKFAEGLQPGNFCEMTGGGLSKMGLKILTPNVGRWGGHGL